MTRSEPAAADVATPFESNASIRSNNLPAPVADLIGRETDLLQLIALQSVHRLLTLTGPGGIGKTSLALTAARRLRPDYPDGVWLVDFAALSGPELIPAIVASALDLRRLELPLTPERIAAAIGLRQLLLVLDNCEHVIEAAARTTEALLHGAPGARIIATSREPLRAEGECLFHVPPLEVPPPGICGTSLLSRHGAVHLFLARVQASGTCLNTDARVVGTIGEICRRLDGIPLAIELAAARAMVLGVDAVAAGLDDRFRLLTAGRRTALPRQQTLRATCDWSFDLLTAPQRAALSRLGVFIGSFTLAAAAAVTADVFRNRFEAADCIAGLVSKSLVGVEGTGGRVRYRMLETMRLYALKLLDPSALRSVQRRHLEFYEGLMQRAAAAWETSKTDEWLAEYGADIDNVRAALQWGFSPVGDMSLSAELAAAATPLWRELSLHSECRRWAEQALDIADTSGTLRELVLLTAYGTTLLNTGGGDEAKTEAVLQRALKLAKKLGHQDYILRAGYSRWVHLLHATDYRAAFDEAVQFRAAAHSAGDPTDVLIGDRMVGNTQHYLGHQAEARLLLERTLRQPMPAVHRSREARFGVDQFVATLTAIARVRALQGEPDQAMATARQAVAAVERTNRIISLCHALGELCVVALWTGCQEVVGTTACQLLDLVAHYELHFWEPHAFVVQGNIASLHGDAAEAAAKFDAARRTAVAGDFDRVYPSLVGSMAAGELHVGRNEQAYALVEGAVRRNCMDECWYAAELFLLQGVLLLASDRPDAERVAEAAFARARERARRDAALTLELRAATRLSALVARRGDTMGARKLLGEVYDRFTEGFDTGHLRAARELLVQWRDARPVAA